VFALARFEAVFALNPTKGLTRKKAQKVDKVCGEEAGALYDAEVAPLMERIERTPALTLSGFAAKAQVFITANIIVTGTATAQGACAQMLDDLAKLAGPAPERVEGSREAA
jgi:hypothetical protein